MRRATTALLALFLFVALFAAGTWVSTADAAPALRWSQAEAAYYSTLAPAVLTLQDAMVEGWGQSVDMTEVEAARDAILDLDAPVRLFAVRELAHYAAQECANTISYFSTLPNDNTTAMLAGMLAEMRGHCMMALRDVRVETARFAALNGGFPIVP